MVKQTSFSIFTVLCLLAVATTGCSDYPEFSPKAYDISTALYSTCRRADEANLQKLAELTAAELESAQISEREAQWLREIITQAEQGEWQAAAAESRSILEAQVVGR